MCGERESGLCVNYVRLFLIIKIRHCSVFVSECLHDRETTLLIRWSQRAIDCVPSKPTLANFCLASIMVKEGARVLEDTPRPRVGGPEVTPSLLTL